MNQFLQRREWLKQTTLALGGMAFTSSASAINLDCYELQHTIRLHANENPYGPSPLSRKAMATAIVESNIYPWDNTTLLREKIATGYGLTKEYITMGAGSSEILGLVSQFAALKNGNAVVADPTFGIWFTSAEKAGLQIMKVPLTTSKVHDLQRMKEQINDQTRLVYVCNPNNPTGTVLPADELKTFINEVTKKTSLLLDEAYIEYAGEPTQVSLVKDNPRLIIAKTFSKIYGMAGARIGFAIAHPDTTKQLNELQPWVNAGSSAVSVAGAIAALDDHAFVQQSKQKNAETKDQTYAVFRELNIPFIPSLTNFIYYSLNNTKKDVLAALTENNIRAGRIVEETGKWTRISIGKKNEMELFASVLRKSMAP